MTRLVIRVVLMGLLLASTAVAAWSWLRPYSWHPDPAARCKVADAMVRRDQSFFWVDIYLTVMPGQTHDMMKPVRLLTSAGRALEPADTILGGDKDHGNTNMLYKFWLDAADIQEALTLQINDGTLEIKADPGMPGLRASGSAHHLTNHW